MERKSPNNLGISKNRKKSATYDYVSQDARNQLIQLIEREKWAIKDASEELKLNYSTAKSVLRLFRNTGKIEINRKKKQAKAPSKIKSKRRPKDEPESPSTSSNGGLQISEGEENFEKILPRTLPNDQKIQQEDKVQEIKKP